MEFITTGNRIAVENFSIGKIYTITWLTGTYKNLACVGIGSDFVMFQDQSPELLFTLTMGSAQAVSSIEEGSSGGTTNYNELDNKPSINGFVLVGNKTGADLGLVSQSDLDNYVTDSELATELEDYATNASVVAALASKQDALSSEQLAAVNSGITSALVNQIGTNTSAIAGKQDALSSEQLAAVNSGITSADVAQITTNKNNISLLTPTVVGGVLASTTTDYSLVSTATVTVPNSAALDYAVVGRVTATYYSGTYPRGLILSKSNDISDFNTAANLIAKVEPQDNVESCAVDAIVYNATDNDMPIYVWFKGNSTSGGRLFNVFERFR